MARPTNVVVVKNGIVFSVAPKKLREWLESRLAGSETDLPADTMVGVISRDISNMTTEDATSLLSALNPKAKPVKVETVVPTETALAEVA